ncbi:hypothetical protein TIFTF001_055230 [Ficus carica]|uniref:F-box domain-containing protein n=1 Tax=Ficus carica TaxID=3494 RepID=A0AA88ECZ7_FICCA|nr:hypothetical protein TIFTF001_055230 [Ficus carica]
MVPGSKKSKSSPVEKQSPSVDNFGKDLLLQIFLRLPDCQSAIRCLAVSKLWYSLISDHHFICSFIHRQKSPNSGAMLYALLLQFSNAPSSLSFFVTPFILHQRRPPSLSYSYYLSLLPIPFINMPLNLGCFSKFPDMPADQTGKWDMFAVSSPRRLFPDIRAWNMLVVVFANGMLHWLDGLQLVNGIFAFDLFNRLH